MKTYQVTRKLQVTIPKNLAKQLGIRPGDAVIFEEVGGAVVVKRAGAPTRDYAELKEVVEALATDMARIGKHIKVAERGLTENLSRHISS